jgi:hypothetical protein
LSNTIFVAEARDPVPWSKPADLVYDPNGLLPAFGGRFGKQNTHFRWRFDADKTPGFGIGFGDGVSSFVRSDADERILRALITRNGGETEGREDLKW